MDKLNKRFIDGEVVTAANLNALVDKTNEVIDTNDDLYQVAEQVNEIKTTINNLPNAQAVSVQVQRNTEAIATKADKANTPTNSSFVGTMGAGYALQLIGSGKGETRYGEVFPAGRPWGDAGQLTPEGGATNFFNGTDTFPSGMAQHFPSQVQGTKSITVEKIGGDCLGGNQMVKNGDFLEGTNGWTAQKGTIAVSKGVLTLTATVAAPYLMQSNIANCPTGHKFMLNANVNKAWRTFGYDKSWSQAYISSAFSSMAKILTATKDIAMVCIDAQDGTGFSVDDISLLDLTTLFPSPAGQKFVNNLTNNEASALAVAQRLAYFDYTIRY